MIHFEYDIIPNYVINTFYTQIKRCINENQNYDHYIRNLIKLNGKIPDIIQKLIDEQTTNIK